MPFNAPEKYKEQLNYVIGLNDKAQKLKIQVWQQHVVFTWHWWLSVALAVIPWVVWSMYRRRESSGRMMFVGFFIMLLATIFDFLGTKLGGWYYYYDIIPFIPSFMPWDLTLMPVTIMFLIEVRPRSNPFLKAVFFACVIAFMAEPIAWFVGLYEPVHWRHIYSAPIYFAMFLMAYYISKTKHFDQVSS